MAGRRSPGREQQAPEPEPRPLIRLEKVAVILDLSYEQVKRYVREGKIPAVHLGDLVRVRPESLEKLLAQVERGEVTL